LRVSSLLLGLGPEFPKFEYPEDGRLFENITLLPLLARRR
jgi:hypothetical protein